MTMNMCTFYQLFFFYIISEKGHQKPLLKTQEEMLYSRISKPSKHIREFFFNSLDSWT